MKAHIGVGSRSQRIREVVDGFAAAELSSRSSFILGALGRFDVRKPPPAVIDRIFRKRVDADDSQRLLHEVGVEEDLLRIRVATAGTGSTPVRPACRTALGGR